MSPDVHHVQCNM